MGRDYKKPRDRASRARPAASPVKFLFGGFALGVIAAAIVYYLLAPAPPREPDRPVPAAARVPPSAEATDEGDDDVVAARPARPAPVKERFDFYDVLPNYEVIITETEERVADAKPSAQVRKPGAYVLQAGSFRRFADADRMKAQLALQGIESTIQRVTIGDDKTYHRVRIGPETELRKVNDLRTRLREQNIDALLIRVAE